MSVPLSAEAQTLLRLLDDYEWHSYWDIHLRLAETVAPGKALRRYEGQTASRQRIHGIRVKAEISEDQKINAGQRGVATHTIHSMRRRFVEVAGAAQDRMIRRRREPLPVAPRGTGRREMQPIDSPPVEIVEDDTDQITDTPTPPGQVDAALLELEEPMAFLDPLALRSLVAAVVAAELADHRQRIQSWLGVRLAELERRIREIAEMVEFVSTSRVNSAENPGRAGKNDGPPVSENRTTQPALSCHGDGERNAVRVADASGTGPTMRSSSGTGA